MYLDQSTLQLIGICVLIGLVLGLSLAYLLIQDDY